MVTRKRSSQGFTLVEILIVVVILGILAAIVIPQFTSASETAKQSSLESQLQTIRSQLELYQVQHNGAYPTAAQLAGFDNMTKSTDVDGSTDGTDFGPYLQKAPVNPFTPGANGGIAGAAPLATVGWVYDPATGSIKASMDDAQLTDLTLDPNDCETY